MSDRADWPTPKQRVWIAGLSPSQRRRFDALRSPPASIKELADVGTLAFLLDVAEAGAGEDPIIAPEVERILGPMGE